MQPIMALLEATCGVSRCCAQSSSLCSLNAREYRNRLLSLGRRPSDCLWPIATRRLATRSRCVSLPPLALGGKFTFLYQLVESSSSPNCRKAQKQQVRSGRTSQTFTLTFAEVFAFQANPIASSRLIRSDESLRFLWSCL